MYYEYGRLTGREEWKYTYSGSQLAPRAEELRDRFDHLEQKARERVSSLLEDRNVPHDDQRIKEAQQDIVRYGQNAEQCSVFAWEFKRNPNREYHLSLGDVVFFELIGRE